MISDLLYRLVPGPLELLFDVLFALAFRLTGNPGISIALLSLGVNLLMTPLYRRADAVQAGEREQARRLKPGIDKIRRAFRGDERFMILQTYYRQNHYKPYYVLKGSVSLLLEIPFFLAAYRYLSSLGLLQGTAFGPIGDLGKPDGLLMLSGTAVNLLPLLMTAVNLASGAVYTRGLPLRNRIQVFGIGAVFLVLLYRSPSGLVLYWTLNNVFSLARNLLSKKREKRPDAETAEEKAPDRHGRTVFLAGCLLLTVLLGVLIPSAIVDASPGEFVEITDFRTPLRYVGAAALTAAGTFLVWGQVFYALASRKGRKRLTAGIAVLSAAAVADYMFFGQGYGNLSPMLKYDHAPAAAPGEVLLNLAVLAAVAGLVVLLLKKKPEILAALCIAGCIGLAVMSGMNVQRIAGETVKLEAAARETLAERERAKPRVTFSRTGKNVCVIMLDRCISGFVPYIFEENPQTAEQFRGFTYYPNTLAFGKNTNVCTPSLYGGYEYRPFELNKRTDMALPEKQNEALKVMPVLFDENGWEVTVCDPPYAGYLWIPDLSIYDDYPSIHRYNSHGAFVEKEEEAIRKKDRTLFRNLFCYSVFRACPVILQPAAYNEGRYNEAEAQDASRAVDYEAAFFEQSELKSTGISDEYMKAYTVLQHLPEFAVAAGAGESAGGEGTFLLMSNTATHDVTMLQEPEFEPRHRVDNTEYEAAHRVRTSQAGGRLELKTIEQMEHYQSDTAALKLLGQWFDFLRESGVWDNTRIILVSDHGWELGLSHLLTGREEGENGLAPYEGIMAYNALMMIKDFGSSGEFTVREDFMTIADTPTEAMRGLIDNPVNPFTGKAISAEAKNEAEQYVMLTDWRIAENHGVQYSDPIRLTLKKQWIFDESNWAVP